MCPHNKDMTKLNMRLRTEEEDKIKRLKSKYGFETTPELFRFLLQNPPIVTSKKSSKGGRIDFNIEKLRKVLNEEGKDMGGTGEIEHNGVQVTGVFWKYS